MIVIPRLKVPLFATISMILLFLLSCSSPVYALGLPPSPWPGPDLTYSESQVLAFSADDGHALLRILEKSAQQDDANAMMGLTLYYQHIHQFQKAVFWAKKGAHAGNPHSESYLGFAYYHGHGIKKNLKKSIYWLEKAASQHNYPSEYFLAYLHQHGKGGFSQNVHAAIPLYEAAAHDGSFSAAQALSEIYKNGKGALHNKELADYWAHFAPKQGWSGDGSFMKAYLDFEKYKRDGNPVTYKKEQKLALQGNSLYRDYIIIYFAIAWIILSFQIRKSWKNPEGSSAIFWTAITLLELYYCAGYLLNVIKHVDSFVILSRFTFYGVNTIMCSIIAWSALFRREKKIKSHVAPLATNKQPPE